LKDGIVSDAISDAPRAEGAEDYSTAVPDVPELGLAAKVEGLLFVSSGAVQLSHLANVLQVHVREIEAALHSLAESYRGRGIRLQRHDSRAQLTSAPELSQQVERFLGLEATTHLTQAALEVLAIVAYQQPVTRPHIDAVRGVNSESVLGTLLRHSLIDESGRSDGPGRPILYVTTPEFLRHFGLNSLGELPPLILPPVGPPSPEAGDLSPSEEPGPS
jgi:segregation and condensation protein B